jgi:hypothetical protein
MAATGAGEGKGEENLTNTGLNGERIHDENKNTKANGTGSGKRASRFRVARVDSEKNGIEVQPMNKDASDAHDPASESSEEAAESNDAKTTKADPTVVFQLGDETAAPGSPCPEDSTHRGTYDTQNQRTFAHNTIETVPHLDHYRNIMSLAATGGELKQRPTLLELHELDHGDLEVRTFLVNKTFIPVNTLNPIHPYTNP